MWLVAATASTSNVYRSCSVMTSDSMRCTSVIATTRRVPSCMRSIWIIRSSGGGDLLADRSQRQVVAGHQTIVSRRASASRGELAWSVDSDPS